MKQLITFFAGLLVLSACTTQYHTANTDDVYYSPSDQPVKKQTMVVKTPESNTNSYTQEQQPMQQQQAYEQANVNTDTAYYDDNQQYNAGNYSDAIPTYGNDNYDYEYSSRVRRFYDPYSYNYYSDYYCCFYKYIFLIHQ